MNLLFRAAYSFPRDAKRTRHPLVTLIIPCLRLLRRWGQGGYLPRTPYYGDTYSRFQPMVAPIRATPHRHRPLPRW